MRLANGLRDAVPPYCVGVQPGPTGHSFEFEAVYLIVYVLREAPLIDRNSRLCDVRI
jgi:hypothetical protein